MNWPILILVGITAGVLSGFFGIGGGIVLIPFLMIGLGYNQYAANGTSLVALLAPVGILGVLEYYRAGKINSDNIKAGLIITLGMFLGAFIGAKMAVGFPVATLRRAFAIFLAFVAFKIWFSG